MKSALVVALCMLASSALPNLASLPYPLQSPLKIGSVSNQNPQSLPPACVMPDDEYILSWKWTGGFLNGDISAQFYWNGKKIADIHPKDKKIRRASYNVKAHDGANKLRITASGGNEATGFSIDDITLVKKGKAHNFIRNGDFEQNSITFVDTRCSILPEWNLEGSMIQKGPGYLFNKEWKSQVIELESQLLNSIISQEITLSVPSDRKRQEALKRKKYTVASNSDGESVQSESYSESQSCSANSN